MSPRAAGFPPPCARSVELPEPFRLLAEHAPVMIWLAGPDRQCVFVNRFWLRFTGRALGSELGLGWMEGIHPEDREAFVPAYAAAFEARAPFEAQLRLRSRDGSYRWLADRGAPLLHDSELTGFVGSCVDITDRLAAEEAARTREEEFQHLSHELRSPLNGIKSWAHVLENQLRDPDPATRRALQGILTGVEDQVRLIERGLMKLADRAAHPRGMPPGRPRSIDSPKGAPMPKTGKPAPERDALPQERPEHEPDPATLEGPGDRQEAKGESDTRAKTTRRGEY